MTSKGDVQVGFMENRNFIVHSVNMIHKNCIITQEIVSWFKGLREQALNNDNFESEDHFDNEAF